MLPVQLQRAMAAEAEAAREARAKVIAAEGERDASESLTEAAKVIQRSPQALQVNLQKNLSLISIIKYDITTDFVYSCGICRLLTLYLWSKTQQLSFRSQSVSVATIWASNRNKNNNSSIQSTLEPDSCSLNR